MNTHPDELSDELSDEQKLDIQFSHHPDCESLHIHLIIEILEAIGYQFFIDENSSIAILGIKQNRIIYYNSNNTPLLKHPAVNMGMLNNRKLINLITHPDDLAFWDSTYLNGYKMMMEMPVTKLDKFWIVGSRRLLEEDNQYHSYIQQIKPLVIKGMMCPGYIVLSTKRFKGDVLPQFRLYSLAGAPYTEEHPYSAELLKLNLLSYEKKLLELYSLGHTGEKVAKQMGIAVSTLKRYSGRINTKMKVPNIKASTLLWKLKQEAVIRD